ncbi:carbon-nitrogen hydrolase family protein [Acidisphaera sp. L21]|uniref:carbon-nitrogen hydrolase family protein n=1 Tax=Acidisphaera sp. L21 TaxID=1641851 RepID=UPI00131CB23A|nr:carbon-nitrogen hydrolase family protein [Acidisphaera sp. L21]
MRLGLLQYRVGRYAGVAEWGAGFAARIAEAAAAGAELLVLPEYACIDAVAAPLPDLAAELNAACALHDAILAAMQRAAARHGVWLLGGSLPWRRVDGSVVNHAPLVAPDGRIAFQDKHCTTRFEAELWGVSTGAAPSVFETPWGRIGVSICYDMEHPALPRAQVEAGAWLILVPTDTDTLAGFNRVRLAARACAMANQCYVAVATTVGDAPWLSALDTNRGYAAVFGPVDRGFPDDGVIIRGEMDAPGWLYADLDPAAIAAVRQDGAVLNHRDYAAAPPACPVVGG